MDPPKHSQPRESQRFLQDWESINAANQQREEYRKKLDQLVEVVQRAKTFIHQKADDDDLAPGEQQQRDEWLKRLFEHLADVNKHTQTLIPRTNEEELEVGYTKTHMVTLFLREDFEEYDRLAVFAEILKYLPDIESFTSDELLLTEIKTYVENFGVLYDTVTEQTEADPILRDLHEMESASENQETEADTATMRETEGQDDQLDGLLMEEPKPRRFASRSVSSPLKRALSILSTVRSPTNPGKVDVRRRQIRPPVLPEKIPELQEEADEGNSKKRKDQLDITPQTSNVKSEKGPVPDQNESTPVPHPAVPMAMPHPPLAKHPTNPVTRTTDPASSLTRFLSNPVTKSTYRDTPYKQTKNVQAQPSPPTTVPDESDSSWIPACPPSMGTTNTPVQAPSSADSPKEDRNSSNVNTYSTPTINVPEEAVVLGRTPSPWSEKPTQEEVTPVHGVSSSIPTSPDPPGATDIAKAVDNAVETRDVEMLGSSFLVDPTKTKTFGFPLLQSLTNFWKPDKTANVRPNVNPHKDSCPEPSLFPFLFRQSSEIPAKKKKDSVGERQNTGTKSGPHQIQTHMKTVSDNAATTEPPRRGRSLADTMTSTDSDSRLQHISSRFRGEDAGPTPNHVVLEPVSDHVKVVLARSDPSGISSVSSHDSNTSSTGVSKIPGEKMNDSPRMNTIRENSVPVYMAEDSQQGEPLEIVFWDEGNDTASNTSQKKKKTLTGNWVSSRSGTKRSKREQGPSKVSSLLTRLQSRRGENDEGDGIERDLPVTTHSVVVYLVVLGELIMDVLINLISLRHILREASCCDVAMTPSETLWAVTFLFFGLVIVELIMLFYSAWQTAGTHQKKKKTSPAVEDGLDDSFHDETDSSKGSRRERAVVVWDVLLWTVCVNPFIACLLIWALMYELEERRTALTIVYLKGVSIALMYATLYLERRRLSVPSLTAHAIPIVPFFVTCFIVWFFLARGGVCFYASDGQRYWFDGCALCPDGWPPDDGGLCPGDDVPPSSGSYCGTEVDVQFCYTPY